MGPQWWIPARSARSGLGARRYPSTFADGVLRVAWEAATRTSRVPSLAQFAEAIIAELAAARAALIGPVISIRSYMGLAGLLIPEGRTIELPWGVIREVAADDASMIPNGLRGKLQTNTPEGPIVIDYAGDCVLQMDVPYQVLLARPNEQSEPWPLDLISVRTADERLQTIRIALLLSSERPPMPIVVGTWRSFLDPLAIGARGTSWRDPRRLPPITPVALSEVEVDSWAHWIALVDEAPTQGIEVALRRTLLAAAERADALVDAVIAWENLFGSRSGEPTLRISSSMAWLLSDSAAGRAEVRREVGRLYALRSDVVHSDRKDLLQCRNGEERSNRLILDA